MKLSGDVAILRLNNGKANAIDLAFLDKLDRFLEAAETVGARAVVITGYDRFFSAGLALPSLLGLDRPAMHAFISRFSETMLRLYASPFPMIAAVNGHAIAGGCVLALMADVRMMVEDDGQNESKIGLNEVQLGIGLPSSVTEPLRATVPASSLLPIAQEGRLFTPTEAQALRLVDELHPRTELEARAVARAQALAEIPPSGFSQVKTALRRPVLEIANRYGAEQTERWLDTWFSDAARRRIIEVVGRLQREQA